MSAQKTFSQLSIAAVVLFVVSIPCLAQTDSIATEKSSTAETVAVNTMPSLPMEERSVFEAKQKAPKFSAAQFMQAAESTVVAAKPSVTFQPVVAPNGLEQKKSNALNGITFVPSRGQKLPE